ncbi:hypothetical protein VMCG_00543 [Cytospora schulzeri]|uniref:Uncharacterized protein n=1 Tax=Cytospora schulzeri TaxID=448051 RepID=A0A423X8L5_9PEZI|nr:hypothetical protein VMCG_00543 [Valsa malicola]
MSSSQRDLQSRFSREPAPRHSDLPGFALIPPLRSLGTRRNPATSPGASSGRPSRPSRAGRPRPPERYRTSDYRPPNPASFEALEEDLVDANSQLRALLDYTSATIMSPLSPSSNPHTAQNNQAEDSRRVKRRKLDSERTGSSSKGFRYGRFGQIEPGQLRMEIESCDGGIYADEKVNPPENILKNDDSVVREGMVFISMASDEVLARTAQYQIQYVPSPEDQTATAEQDNRIPILSVRHNEDGTTSSVTRVRQRRIYLNSRMEEAADHKTAVFPVDPLPFPVTVATDCSDAEESPHHRLRREPPNRIGLLPFESDDSEDGENAFGSWNDEIQFEDDDDSPPPTYRHTQDMTLAEAAEASQLATQEAVRAVGGELLAPHAKFFIEKGKNRCTIKFDPPVSGRYILLKMYHPSDNIDIQGVFANGFAGPRYFPSLDLR